MCACMLTTVCNCQVATAIAYPELTNATVWFNAAIERAMKEINGTV